MTTGDWDFSNANWTLTILEFVSPPSSLLILGINGVQETRVLVKVTTVPIVNVKEGRLVTQYLMKDKGGARDFVQFLMRWQDANNNYLVQIRQPTDIDTLITIGKRVGGVYTNLWNGTIPLPFAVWHNMRVTWWNDYVGLVIRVEYWDGASWVVVHDAYDAPNHWKDIGGRVGWLIRSGTIAKPSYIDDSFIYGIPP